MIKHPHRILDEKTFYPQLYADLRNAKGRIVICSPFITIQRVQKLRKHLEDCISRGVVICVYAQEPLGWNPGNNPPDLKAFEGAVEYLEQLGVHVTLVKKIHMKVVVIDDRICYEGSLNVLSHYDTRERMTLWDSTLKVREVTISIKLNACRLCFPINESVLAYIGDAIAESRRRASLSQDDLSQVCKLGQKVISRVEQARQDTRLTTVARLLDSLNKDLVVVPRHLLPAVHKILARDD